MQSDAEAAVFAAQAPTIVALTKGCTHAAVARDIGAVPAGCGSSVLSETLAVHILVRVRAAHIPFSHSRARAHAHAPRQGLVDLDAECAKCDRKLGLAALNADKLRKTAAQPDYETTIPAAVRASNAEKVRPGRMHACARSLTRPAAPDVGCRDRDATTIQGHVRAIKVVQ